MDYVVKNNDVVIIRIQNEIIYFGKESEMDEKIKSIYQEFNYTPTSEEMAKIL